MIQMLISHLFMFCFCFAVLYYDPLTINPAEIVQKEPQDQLPYGDYEITLLSSLSKSSADEAWRKVARRLAKGAPRINWEDAEVWEVREANGILEKEPLPPRKGVRKGY